MRKTLGRVAVLAACVLVASAALAGSITGRGAAQPTVQTIFRIDTPAPGATVFGIVGVSGYVLDARGVARVTLLVDGAPVHDADINQPRQDVRTRYARFNGEDFPYDPGFSTSFLASNYAAGAHTIGIRVTYSNSDVEDLGIRTVTVDTTVSQAPIGALDSPRDPAVYGVQDYISGVFPVVGWALDAVGIRQRVSPAGCNPATDATCHILADIEVMVDGMVVGQALYPLQRSDVANAHPDVAGAFQSGFQMNLDTSKYTNGAHTVSVRAWDTAGLSTVLGSRDVWFNNGYATLAPFGHIDWPMGNAHFFSTGCFSPPPISGIDFTPGDHVDWVSGWAIDQNDQTNFVGIKSVQLLFDGAMVSDTEVDSSDCNPFVITNAPDCKSGSYGYYGIDRPDVFYQYPQFTMDAKNSGYLFAVNTRYFLQTGQLHIGLNIISVQVRTRDPLRPAVVIDQIPVIVDCTTDANFSSFGDLEVPVAMQSTMGNQLVRGWVFDVNNAVVKLNFYIDGVLDGSLVAPNANLHIYRPDVQAKYPFLPYNVLNSGFQYTLDTTKYVDGVHQLVIQTVDGGGQSNYWVQRPLVFNNLNRP
jgi:N-acetylmuramoyl-L-alanine amidase